VTGLQQIIAVAVGVVLIAAVWLVRRALARQARAGQPEAAPGHDERQEPDWLSQYTLNGPVKGPSAAEDWAEFDLRSGHPSGPMQPGSAALGPAPVQASRPPAVRPDVPPATHPAAAREPQIRRAEVLPAEVSENGHDGTLRLLPGRLEPSAGYAGHEVRFVMLAGLSRYTLGRGVGPIYEHIQLSAPTVSRMHAFMEYERGAWRIGNLSDTNQVVINGAPLNGEVSRPLRDGDLIEMGEVVFRFRER